MASKDDLLGKLAKASKDLVHRVQENIEEATHVVQENLEEVACKVNALLATRKQSAGESAEQSKRMGAFVVDTEDAELLNKLLPTAPKISHKEAKKRKLPSTLAAIKRIPVYTSRDNTSWDEQGVERLKRLVHEVIFLEELQSVSPHIVELHGAGLFRTSKTSEDRELWIVMEFVDGVDLSKLLEEDNIASLNVRQLRAVFAFAARAVNVLHSKDIVHRDIKGSNLVLSREGMVKVLDFDVACKLNESNPVPTFLAGSPAYMSPEMVDCKGNNFASYIEEGNVPVHDFKVDVWALGMTLLELAMGEEPVSTIAQDDYEVVSEYLSGMELEPEQSALGAILNDFFAEAPRYVDRWSKLIGFEDRISKDYSLEQFHKDIATVSAIEEIFQKEHLQNVDLVLFTAECLIRNPKTRPSISQLVDHPFISSAVNELEGLEKVLSKKQAVKKEDYPLTVKEAARLHYGYENFVF